MGPRIAPDLRNAEAVGALVQQLEQHCPLQAQFELPIAQVVTLDLWKLEVHLGGQSQEDRYADLPVDLRPLLNLCRGVFGESAPPMRWVYDFYYFELLAHEKRMFPAFWVDPDRWLAIRRACQLTLEERVWEAGEWQPPHERWEKRWRELVEEGVVQYQSPRAWLEMLAFDEDLAAEYGFNTRALVFRMVPVYLGVTADHVRRAMADDMAEILLRVPWSDRELVARWEGFADRLGFRQRWPTRKAQLRGYREALVLARVRQGLSPAQIAEELVDAGLYPIYERRRGKPGGDTLENARRTTYRIINTLVQVGRIKERPEHWPTRGRPRKADEESDSG